MDEGAAPLNQQQQQTTGGSPTETTDGTVSNSTLQNEVTSGEKSDSGKVASASATAKASRKRTKTGCLSQSPTNPLATWSGKRLLLT